jgi:hypothetical protein
VARHVNLPHHLPSQLLTLYATFIQQAMILVPTLDDLAFDFTGS